MIFLPDGRRSVAREKPAKVATICVSCAVRVPVVGRKKEMKLILDNVVLQRRQLEIKIWKRRWKRVRASGKRGQGGRKYKRQLGTSSATSIHAFMAWPVSRGVDGYSIVGNARYL